MHDLKWTIVYQFWNDQEITINDLARRVRALADSKSEIVHVPYEKTYGPGFEDMRRRTPNIDKIRQAIGYEPTYGIDQILVEVIEYFKGVELSKIVMKEEKNMVVEACSW